MMAESAHNHSDKSVVNLLYPPGAIRTPNQKRTQIILTLELIRQIKKKFNEHFDMLYRTKEEEMEKSDQRNERVAQILQVRLAASNEHRCLLSWPLMVHAQ
jgi:hypothetical protein